MNVTWPIKRFLNYVCGKLLSGYLESDLDFEKLHFKDGVVSVSDVVLRAAKLNEQLVGFPYKIMRASIHNLSVAVPLRFLAENTKIVVSDIDVLLMPIASKGVSPEAFMASPQKSPPQPREAAAFEPEREVSLDVPQDEDGLTRSINKLLANIECEVRNLAIRVIFSEFDSERMEVNLPTLLVRFSRIVFGPAPGESRPENLKKLAKQIEIHQYGVFLMNRPILSVNEYGKDPLISKLVFPFTYPIHCHPSAILVGETNRVAKITCRLDTEKNRYEATIHFNNIDVILSPLQIFTLTQVANYSSHLLSSQDNIKEQATVEKNISSPSPKTVLPEGNSFKINFELIRTDIKIFHEDSAFLKRYFHSYESDELFLRGLVNSVRWKFAESFLEFTLVRFAVDLVSSRNSTLNLDCSFQYSSLENLVYQNYSLKEAGHGLEDSISTIYGSAQRMFSVNSMEMPNLLSEDLTLSQKKSHYCVQHLFRVGEAVSVDSPTAASEEYINSKLPTLSKKESNAMVCCITVDSSIGIKEITGKCLLSPIFIDFSLDIILLFDQIFSPCSGMAFQFPAAYSQVLRLYMIPESKKSEIVISVDPKVAPSKKSVLIKSLEISIPLIRLKYWNIDARKNPLFDYLKERNVDSVKSLLEKIRKAALTKQASLYTRDAASVAIQICRCMDVMRIAQNIREGNSETRIPSYAFYRDELIVLDISGIICNISHINPEYNTELNIMIADITLLGNVNFEIQTLAHCECSRESMKITMKNSFEPEKEIPKQKLNKEESSIKSSKMDIITVHHKEGIKIDLDNGNNANPFSTSRSDLSEREREAHKNAQIFVSWTLSQIFLGIEINYILGFAEYIEHTSENILKLQSILEGKAQVYKELQSEIIRQATEYSRKMDLRSSKAGKPLVIHALPIIPTVENPNTGLEAVALPEDISKSNIKVAFSILIDDFTLHLLERRKIIEIMDKERQDRFELFPLFFLKLQASQLLLYKRDIFDTNVKFNTEQILGCDNTLVLIPYGDESGKEKRLSSPSSQFHYSISRDMGKDTQFFCTKAPDSVVLYKEFGVKTMPALSLTLGLIDNTVRGYKHPEGVEVEMNIDLNISGCVIRPELHSRLIPIFLACIRRQLEERHMLSELMHPGEILLERTLSGTVQKAPISVPVQAPTFNTLINFKACLRNTTIDMSPSLVFEEEIDKNSIPKLIRANQRAMLMVDSILLTANMEAFKNKSLITAQVEDLRLIMLDKRKAPLLILDPEATFNSTFSPLYKYGFKDLLVLEDLHVLYDSIAGTKSELSSLTVGVCPDSLVSTVQWATSMSSSLEMLLSSSIPKKVDPEILQPSPTKPSMYFSFHDKASPQEEIKLDKPLENDDEDLLKEYDIVEAGKEIEESTCMQKAVKISTSAMKDALQMVDAEADYYSNIVKKPDSRIVDSDLIVNKDESGDFKITKKIEFDSNYVQKPRKIVNQYEQEYHILSPEYPIPIFSHLFSCSKISLCLFQGQDFDENSEKSQRKSEAFVEFSVNNVGVVFNIFPEDSPCMMKFTVSLQNFNSVESLSSSSPSSLLKIVDHETADFFLLASMETINTNFHNKSATVLPELGIKLKLEPIEIFLHQRTLELFMDYATFSKNLFQPSHSEVVVTQPNEFQEPSELKPELFIRKVIISRFYVKFNYRSTHLSVSKLYQKDFLELLNLTDIRDLIIVLQKFEGNGFNSVEELLQTLIIYYKEDISKRQYLTLLSSVSPIRSILNVFEGFLDIFRLPVYSYRANRRIISGLTKGIGSFVSKVASETKLLGQSIYNFVANRFVS